jgi:putative peptidoglycan lipid II flippase
MVRRIFEFFYKETSTLHKAAYLLGFFAVLSQILAFLRDRLLAHVFGAGADLDTYYAAFRIPDFLFVTIASVVSISVIVPFIVEKEKYGQDAVRSFVDNIFTFFSFLIIVTCTIAFFLIPSLSGILFKGFSGESLSKVILLSRIFLLSPIALGFSNLFGSLTQAYNRFTIYAFAPLVYNLGIILGTVLLAPHFGVIGVAVGVVAGSIFHALVQVPFVIKIGLFPTLKRSFDWNSIKKVATLSLPRTITLSINHIATIFLVSFASLMAVGSISIFSFSLNIQSVPLSVIGVSYSLAAFPTLSRHFADKNIKAFVEQMSTTARHIIFWSVPVTALFIVLRAQIVRVLLGSGRFDWNDTRLTAAALALFALSATFQSLMLLFVRAFYSAGHTKKPLLINLISTLVLILCTYGLVKFFYYSEGFRYFISSLLKVEDLPGTAVLMLPLGYSIGTILNGIVHWVGFEKDFGGFSKETMRTLFQSFSASVILGYVSYLGLNLFAPLFHTDSLIGIFLQGFLAGILGIIAGIIVLILMKSKELAEAAAAIHSKFWKAKVIASDPEIV